jgi:GAF domain-containing protein
MAATLDEHIAEVQRANADLQRRLDEALAERNEADAHKAAMAEVLEVINSSPGDLAPVFDAILEKAHSLCGAAYGSLQTFGGERFRAVAVRGLPEAFADRLREGFRLDSKHPMSGLLSGERFIHIRDMADIDGSVAQATVGLGGMRTLLSIPLRKDGALLGQIVAARPDVRLFSEKEIRLLEDFAAQAVIAMENARLITETRDRTRDLQQSLEYQTATSDVLKVISRTDAKLEAVLDTLVRTAARICAADQGAIHQLRDGLHFVAASCGTTPEYRDYVALNPIKPGHGTAIGRMALERRVIHIGDALNDPDYTPNEFQRLGRFRTMLAVPLFREDVVIGSILLTRSRVEPFTEKQIELVRTFADQAVIAIENTRLITETREALEQQTATAEVLGVVNSSPGDLAPVFDAILEKAHTLCEAAHGTLTVADGEYFRAVATRGMPEVFAELLRRPFRPSPGFQALLLAGEGVVQVADLRDREFSSDDPIHRAAVEIGGVRTLLMVPLRKDGVLLGYFTANRREVRPFTDKQIALLQNFAAQAVIAMENARLITETREALEYQTATSDVLKVISRSTFDLQPVLDTLIETASRLCDSDAAFLSIREGDGFRYVATQSDNSEWSAFLRQRTFVPGTGSVMGRVALEGKVVQVADITADPDYAVPEAVTLGKIRTMLGVPLLRDGAVVGTFNITRERVEPFTERQIELVRTFADQAVIAIENTRLITETREALEQQTATAEVLGVINSSPGDLAPVFDAMLEKALYLCSAAFGVLWTYDGQFTHAAAIRGATAEYREFLSAPHRPGPGSAQLRLIQGERFVHVADLADSDDYRSGDALPRALVDLGGGRSLLALPLRKDGAYVGAIMIYRQQPNPFPTGRSRYWRISLPRR